MRDIFHKTIKAVFPHNPVEQLEAYADLTDWSLLLEVKSWRKARSASKRELYQEWENILLRKVKWKMAYDTTLSPSELPKQTNIDTQTLTKAIQGFLPKALKKLEFRVDIARQDPRPGDPLEMGERQLFVYTPSTGDVSKDALSEYISPFPVSLSQCRIYALNHEHDAALSHAAEKALAKILKS